MKKDKKEKLSRKEAIRLTLRAMKLWEEKIPHYFLSTTLGVIVQAGTPYVGIWFSAQLINELAGGRDPKKIWLWVILTLAVTGILTAVGAGLSRWRNQLISMAWHGSTKIYSDKFADMDFSIKDRQETEDLFNRIWQDQNWAGWGLSRVYWDFDKLIRGAVQVICSVVLSMAVFFCRVPEDAGWLTMLDHPLVVLGVIALMVGIAFLAPICSARQDNLWANASKESTFGNRFFGFYGFEMPGVERAMDVRMYEQEKLTKHYWQNPKYQVFGPIKSWKEPKAQMGYFEALAEASSVVFTWVTYVFVCLKAWAGAFGVGSVTQFVTAIVALSKGATTFVSTVERFRVNAGFLKTLYEFLDIPNEMYQGSLTTEKRNDRKYQVEFRDVSFRYPGTETYALRHVNVKFEVGKRLAVVGKNGSGKTTFIKLLCRLYDPTEGQIMLNGIDIRKYRYDDYMEIFSVVFQDFQLLALPLGQNVAASKEYDAKRVLDCLHKAGFDENLARMEKGLETYLYNDLKEDGVKVSGGEAQKIAIARSLYKDAPFIILDEPTAALDPIAEADIYSKFDQIVEDKTAIYISHRLSSCRFCDEILVFDQGSVVQKGSHDSLLADEDGKYHQLWFAQAQYYNETK